MLKRFVLTVALTILSIAAHAQYPVKPIHFVVPYPAGAVADSLARIFAHEMTVRLGQPVIVENRPGAEGAIGAESVMRAPPDGYTLLFTTGSPMGAGPAMRKNPSYDPRKDFTPIGFLGPGTFFLVVHPSVPANSVKELIAYARANPDTLNYGTGNAAAIVGTLQFMKSTGIKMTHVPYKGEASALPDLLAGRVQVQLFAATALVMPLAKEGRLRILASVLDDPSPLAPDVPTLDQAGVPGVTVRAWAALFGPRNLPHDIVQRLSREINACLNQAEVRAQLVSQGYDPPRETSPAQLGAYVNAQYEMWRRMVSEAGLPLE
jgi:tripartite-type tricarboxylate transporter receptor subunit TctC